MKQKHITFWLVKLLLLLFIVVISGCSKVPRYLASETKITLLRSGKPVPFKTVIQEINNQPNDTLLVKRISVSDTNGIVTFKEISIGSKTLLGKEVNIIHYFFVTDTGYKNIGSYIKVGQSRLSDLNSPNILVDGNHTYKRSSGTVRFLECDLDSLYLRDVE